MTGEPRGRAPSPEGRAKDCPPPSSSSKESRRLLTSDEAFLQDFKTTLDAAGDCVFMIDPGTMRICYANRGAELHTGYDCDALMKMTLMDITPGYSETSMRQMLDALRQEEGSAKTFDTIHRCQSGEEKLVEIVIQFVPDVGAHGRFIAIARDISDRKAVEEQLRHHALHDDLTGLPNRALLFDHINLCLQHTQRHPEFRFSLLFVDLDRFKVINDSLGHAAGDQLLISISNALRACLRSTDTLSRLNDRLIARIGGDEFVILIPNIHGAEDAVRIAQRIQDALATPIDLSGQEVCVSASIGIAMSTGQYDDPDTMLRDADTAMYRAKTAGCAGHAVFDRSMHDEVMLRLQLESDLRHALERKELYLVYQPIVSLTTSHITGFEALLRWNHPDRGIIPPDNFIPIAEETGLIVPIGEWVLEECCRQINIWNKTVSLPAEFTVSANVSWRQIIEAGFADRVAAILESSGISGQQLTLEITESVIMENPALVSDVLDNLRSLGMELHMDDFGTGYSSLSCLHQFPIDALKIDRQFVANMDGDSKYCAIVGAIVALAHHLKMSVIAEGLEKESQFEQTLLMGCDYGQGYMFSPPVAADVATELIQSDNTWLKSA